MAAATTLCSTGAAGAGRGSIDTSGAGGCRCPLEPRMTRRYGSRTRGRRSAMGNSYRGRERTGDGTARRRVPPETPAAAGVSGDSEVGCCSQRPHLPRLDVAQTGPAYPTPEPRSGTVPAGGSPAAGTQLLVPDAGEALSGQGRGGVDRG